MDNDDLISRKDLLERIEKERAYLKARGLYGADEIVKKGFEGPLTDEERQILIRAIGNGTLYKENTGEWIKNGVGCFKCSICGRGIATSISEKNPSKDYPYCHCGAKMKDGAE